MDHEKAAEARERMVHGIGEFAAGLSELTMMAIQDLAKALSAIDWSALAKLKEADPDLYNWNASGPIRRVQLRRARAMMEGKRK